MVFFNYAAMQMVAKIVYYGPGLCGKTTNLKLIYDRTTPTSRGEIVSLETETDRTLFFDLLPIDVGVIGGFKTKFQLYTVPGQVFYNVTRKLVLKGVDGIVFVADSQAPMYEANLESFKNLKDNLKELGIPIEKTPIVLQYNKRDLKNISKVANLEKGLNPDGAYVSIESSALKGDGVFETLKEISRQTLLKLKTKVVDQEERKKRENIVSFKVQTEEAPPEKDLDDIIDETLEDSISEPEDTLPEDSSLPAFNMSDTDHGAATGIGESSLPSVNLSEVDLDDDEIEIDETDEFIVSEGDWGDESELKLDFEFDKPEVERNFEEEEGFDALEESDLDSLEMEIPALDETVKDMNAPPFMNDEELEPLPVSEDEPESFEKEGDLPAQKTSKDQLEELVNMTRITTKKSTSKVKPNQDILGSFLTSVQGKTKKSDKIAMSSPREFSTAQLNCILVDGNNNVVHTQLVKVKPRNLPNGNKELKVVIEIEVESE